MSKEPPKANGRSSEYDRLPVAPKSRVKRNEPCQNRSIETTPVAPGVYVT